MWVTDAEKRAQLGDYSCNAPQYTTADACFVVCVDYKRLQACCAMNKVEMQHDNADNLLIGVSDASIFAQNLAVAAEAMGLGICYIGGVRTNIAEIDALLGLPDLVFPLFGMTVGRPAEGAVNEIKPRLPVAAVLHENTYDAAKYDEILPAYDAKLAAYYAARATNAKGFSAAYTGAQAQLLIALKRMHISKYIASKGFTFQ